jgi:NTP pyrophosphatase (non-canonical NTP hydrolase)
MQQCGLAKLIEEAGEVMQVAGKLVQYPYHQTRGYPGLHPDGSHLRTRLEQEVADVMAASLFVQEQMGLNRAEIGERITEKLALFRQWAKEP